MKINGEEVELVTDFASLRVGMIVWEVRCDDCGGNHRFMVIGLCADSFSEDGTMDGAEFGVRWELAPAVHNSDDVYIDQWAIDQGDFYRVVDPLLDAKPVTRARELAR